MIEPEHQENESPKMAQGEAPTKSNRKYSKKEINPKHSAFIEHMARTGNQSESARLAGYKSPSLTGFRLMKQPKISLAVQQAQQGLLKRIESDHIEKARRLRRKDNWQAEIVLQMEQAQKEETKARLLEMLGKSESHLTAQDQTAQSINIVNISHEDLVRKARAIMGKIRALPAPETVEYDGTSIINSEASNK